MVHFVYSPAGWKVVTNTIQTVRQGWAHQEIRECWERSERVRPGATFIYWSQRRRRQKGEIGKMTPRKVKIVYYYRVMETSLTYLRFLLT